MKKTTPLILFIFLLSNLSGQILCIQCYQQNDSVYAGGVNLIQNGGFENHNCFPNNPNISFCPNSNSFGCSISNWTCTGGGTMTYSCIFDNTAYSTVPQGSYAAYFGNSVANACSNTQSDTSCITYSACEVSGIPVGFPKSGTNFGTTSGVNLEQTVSGLATGSIYVLEFWAGGESSNSGTYPLNSIFAVDIGFGKTILKCKSTRPNFGIGIRYNIIFKATSASHTIKFTNWGHICGTCTELVVDDVKLYEWNLPSAPCETGITELPENAITLYPNPAINELTVNSEQLTIKEIKIINVLGEVINEKLKMENGKCEVDLKNYSLGIYFVEIVAADSQIIRKRFVKQ